MADIDCEAFDAESVEEFLETTVEIPAALLLAAGCCCCAPDGSARGGWPARRCC